MFTLKNTPFSYNLVISIFALLLTACNQKHTSAKLSSVNKKLFSVLPSKQTGITFVNKLTETLDHNYYQYNYLYIGGGVAAADFNNDGLQDLFFISNSNENKLYLNKGNLAFEDITTKAGIIKTEGFNTGVSVADVNNDGFLDIYIARGGYKDDANKFENLLYINNGNLTFTESAKKLGLNDANRTIQATFFDYDNDNDLDVYVSNTPDITGKTKILDLQKVLSDPKTKLLKGSDRLYENDGTGHFTDVSEKAGLLFDIGFGLNPQVGDINNDGFLDIYVCNDFNFPDLVYINNGNGTFSEERNKVVKHMSFNSMGSDMADINNDGLLDIMTLDMNPQDYVRSKTTMAMTSISTFENMVANNYHYQYMHNMLQINNANGTFSEIAKMAGIADTDWSWSILSADFDLDGYNDVYVTNGVFRDVMDRDALSNTMKELRANNRKPTKEDFLRYTKMLPQQKLNNYFYKNNGNLTFEDTSFKWADSLSTFSNGTVYTDLDNDGDLDIVVNNINDEATILQNNAIELNNGNFIKINLNGPETNKYGLGATVSLHQKNGKIQTRQLVNTKGFLSSVSNTLHFGISKKDSIEKIIVKWLDGKQQTLKTINLNALNTISYSNATLPNNLKNEDIPLLTNVNTNYKHTDPYFNDFDLQVLLPHKLSQTGPALCKGDVNNDGLEDVFIGGGKNQSAKILLSTKAGSFKEISSVFNADKTFEDQSACFFDADNDGDLDLYVVSGSYEFFRTPTLLQDRLYINNGNGNFKRDLNALPSFKISGSVVTAADFDNDGDTDLFVGGRVIPGKYPNPPISSILINNNGKFTIETDAVAPQLKNIGMVTSAVWEDINNDNTLDLIVTGEWMGIEVFLNKNNTLIKSENYALLAKHVGWWNKIVVTDIDGDGDKDIIAGNLGLNYKFHASKEKPFKIYATDFDFNGTEDVILAKEYKGQEVPVRGKTCMTQQLPHLAQKIPNYNDFASRNLEGILGKRLNSALSYEATEFRSGIFVNNGSNGFSFKPFENIVQTSPINSIVLHDFNNDNTLDILVAGNNYQSEVETTRADAGTGHILINDGKGNLTRLNYKTSGLFVDGDVRNAVLINNSLIFIANNNSTHNIYKLN
ncbi:RNA-binding protein [Seonamhaeicola algicola]|uniref:RNA-binding protein n=1 Tax=Seonamhaeicola algicola TaxID=1719036 RepID=A0A5C7AZ74_9FLAO|nr:VCBS repeat-containing protein [Seonamhaeicola algicola]TXE13013.1 RNA-binding protein [Seonamhaeicola algicola]